MSVKSITKSLLVVAVIAASAQMASAATVAYWRFDDDGIAAGGNPVDAGGTVGEVDAIQDSSGNGHHGKPIQVADFTYSSSLPGNIIDPGAVANTLSMTMVGDASGGNVERILVPDDSALDSSLTGMTMEAFVKPTAGGNDLNVFRKWVGGGTSYILQLDRTGTTATSDFHLKFFMNNGASVVAETSALTVPLDEWSHIAGTWDGSTMRVYINGVEESGTSKAFSGSITDSANDLVLGAAGVSGDRAFAGSLDELRISDVALTPAQMLVAIPEPSTIALLLVSAIGFVSTVRRKK